MNSIIIPTDLQNLILSFVETCKICERLDNNIIPTWNMAEREFDCELCNVCFFDLWADCAHTHYHEYFMFVITVKKTMTKNICSNLTHYVSNIKYNKKNTISRKKCCLTRHMINFMWFFLRQLIWNDCGAQRAGMCGWTFIHWRNTLYILHRICIELALNLHRSCIDFCLLFALNVI